MTYEEHFKPGGRNVIFYNDINHDDEFIQNQIADRAYQDAKEKGFNIFFVEGDSKPIKFNFTMPDANFRH